MSVFLHIFKNDSIITIDVLLLEFLIFFFFQIKKTPKKEAQRKHTDNKQGTSKIASKKNIEQMRQERLLRETHEKLRAQAILSPKIQKQDAKYSENNLEVIRSNKRKYNSQYNPDLF